MTRVRGLVTAVILACTWLAAAPASAKRVVYAISVGNNQAPAGDTRLSGLNYADDDALRYFELFQRAGKHAALLTVLDRASQRRYAALADSPQAPTLAELQRTLGRFRLAMEQDRLRGDQPIFFFTYSGHGAQNEQGEYFLAFLDGGLTQQRLYEDVLAQLPNVEAHLIIDACNAEGVVGIRGPFDRESDAELVTLSSEQSRAVVQLHSLARFPFVGALVATSTGQEAHEWSRIEAGVFSHELLSALLGAADVNGDLRVEYSEVQAFVMAAGQTVTDPRAVPQLKVHVPSGNPHAVLIDLCELDNTRFLTGTADEVARLTLVIPDGRRLLDIHVRGPQRVVLALPATQGIYALRGNQEAEVPTRAPVVAVSSLVFQPSQAMPRGRLDHALSAGLFGAPFTTDYYRGMVDSQALLPVDFSAPPHLLPVPVEVSVEHGSTRDTTGSAPAWMPTALVATAGVALATALTTLVLALNTKADFDRTQRMAPAIALSDRYARETTISATALAISLGTGIGAFLLWPRAEPKMTQARLEVHDNF